MQKEEETNPHLEYLLVLDFEATCIEEKKLEPCSEIIEFPIVVVHLQSGKKVDVFHHYVKPTFNPQLSKFCTELTGITQQQVDQGLVLKEVLQELDKWFTSLPYLKQDNFAIVTCGDWDLRTCLRQQSKHKRLYIKNYLRNYINIKKYYSKIIGNQGSQGMMTMLKTLGIPHEGKHHSGIDDVHNICNICIELHKKYQAPFPKTEINTVAFHLPPENIPPQIPYLLVIDFEATCLEKQKIQPCPEIIEMPVTIIDTHAGKELDSFHRYVRPTLNPELSPFCTELTGITQEQVSHQETLEEVLLSFDKWIRSLPYLKDNNFVFVTCGDWDLCTCLRLQAKTKHLKVEKYFQKYINLKAYYPKLVKVKGKITGMMDMLKQLDLKHEGKHHSGIDDVHNIVSICLTLLKNHEAKFSRAEVRSIEL